MDDLQSYIALFRYRRGPVFRDGWRLRKPGQTGDCDDFALNVAYRLAGGWGRLALAVLTLKAVFWLVKSPSNTFWPRHVVLRWRGRGYICSTFTTWRATMPPHRPRLPLLAPWVLLRVVVGLIYTATQKRTAVD